MTRYLLLVEDNPTDEKLAVRAFRKSPVVDVIVVVRDGAEAIDFLFATGRYADREPSQPHLIVLDLKLPRVNGLDVIRRVRENRATALLPIVVLTASKEEEDIARSYELGVNAYVRKPVDFNEFVEAAHALSVFWLSLNEVPPLRRVTS